MYWYSLQLLRFLAAVIVFLFHVGILVSGYKGVDIFFVLSGFVIAYTSQKYSGTSMKVFLINRLSKIYVLYWIALFILFVIAPFAFNKDIFSTFFLFPGHYRVIAVTWSLSYELYFYLLFAFIYFLLPQKMHKTVFIILFCLTTYVVLSNTFLFSFRGNPINFLVGDYAWEFCLGIGGFFMYEKRKKLFRHKLFGTICLMLAFLFFWLQVDYFNPARQLIYGSLSFSVLLCCLWVESVFPSDSSPWLHVVDTLGLSSYGIYLFAPIATDYFNLHDHVLVKVTVLLGIVAGSIFVQKFIEQPILKYIRLATNRQISTSL